MVVRFFILGQNFPLLQEVSGQIFVNSSFSFSLQAYVFLLSQRHKILTKVSSFNAEQNEVLLRFLDRLFVTYG